MQEQGKTQSSGPQTFRCQECGKVLNSNEELREHTRTHHGHGEQSQHGQGQHGQGQSGQGQSGQGQAGQQGQGGSTRKAGGS